MRSVTVAAIQMSCTWDIEANIKKAEGFVRKAAGEGAQIILLQELFETPYFCQTECYEHLELAKTVEDNRAIKHFTKVAKELKVVIPISFFERSGNTAFNSVVVIDADGEIIDLYRKTHIPDGHCYEEKFYFSPGDTGFKVFKTKYGKIGVAICWDQWFPEAARCMALMGAEMLFYPTAIGSEPVLGVDSRAHWQHCMQGHAACNIMPVIVANRVGLEAVGDSQMTFYGSSFITDETGEIKRQMDRESEGVVTFTFDLDEIQKRRYSWGTYRDRRPSMYTTIMTMSDL